MLSESGSNLSQGERQLIAISRAVLSDPAILILDDGEIVMEGTHAELLERPGIYRSMYESQTRGVKT